MLVAIYSLGVELPLLTLAAGFSRARTSLGWLRRHGRGIEIGGGLFLTAIGILFVTGEWKMPFIPLQARLARLG